MTQISEHFTLEELTASENAARLGVSNTPTPEEIAHAKKYLAPGLEQVRALLGCPVLISSGFRSKKLNSLTAGSSDTSQHVKFEAADFTSPKFGSVLDVASKILYSDIKFDQMIYEYGAWVHLSFSDKPRRSVLSKYTGTPYLRGLVDKSGKPLVVNKKG